MVGIAHAAQATGKNWWCNSSAEACARYESGNHDQYIGPTYTDCIDITTGWQDSTYVQNRCNN